MGKCQNGADYSPFMVIRWQGWCWWVTATVVQGPPSEEMIPDGMKCEASCADCCEGQRWVVATRCCVDPNITPVIFVLDDETCDDGSPWAIGQVIYTELGCYKVHNAPGDPRFVPCPGSGDPFDDMDGLGLNDYCLPDDAYFPLSTVCVSGCDDPACSECNDATGCCDDPNCGWVDPNGNATATMAGYSRSIMRGTCVFDNEIKTDIIDIRGKDSVTKNISGTCSMNFLGLATRFFDVQLCDESWNTRFYDNNDMHMGIVLNSGPGTVSCSSTGRLFGDANVGAVNVDFGVEHLTGMIGLGSDLKGVCVGGFLFDTVAHSGSIIRGGPCSTIIMAVGKFRGTTTSWDSFNQVWRTTTQIIHTYFAGAISNVGPCPESQSAVSPGPKSGAAAVTMDAKAQQHFDSQMAPYKRGCCGE